MQATATQQINPIATANISFNDLYKDFYTLVKRTAMKFRFCEAAADDIVQQVFISAWQNLDSVRDIKAIPGWLSTITRNACLKEIKKASRYTEMTEAQESTLVADESLLDNLTWKYSLEILEEVLQTQPNDTRGQIAKLYYLEKKSTKEISENIGLNGNTVLSHLRRFRLAIAKPVAEILESRGIAA